MKAQMYPGGGGSRGHLIYSLKRLLKNLVIKKQHEKEDPPRVSRNSEYPLKRI